MGSVIKRYKMPIICLKPSSWTVGVCVLFYFYGSREALQEEKGGMKKGRGRPCRNWGLGDRGAPIYHALKDSTDQSRDNRHVRSQKRGECSGNKTNLSLPAYMQVFYLTSVDSSLHVGLRSLVQGISQRLKRGCEWSLVL